MPKAKEIKVTLDDGSDLTFYLSDNTIIKKLCGVQENSIGMMSNRTLNGKDALIIVCAPQGVLDLFQDGYDIECWIKEELNKP